MLMLVLVLMGVLVLLVPDEADLAGRNHLVGLRIGARLLLVRNHICSAASGELWYLLQVILKSSSAAQSAILQKVCSYIIGIVCFRFRCSLLLAAVVVAVAQIVMLRNLVVWMVFWSDLVFD